MLIAQKSKSLIHSFANSEKVCVIFHSVNEDFRNPRQILLKGQIVETEEDQLIFKIESFSKGKVVRREIADEFIRKARRKAQKYLNERKITWYRITEY